LREVFDLIGIGQYKEFIHFGLTSYDINSPTVNMMLSGAMQDVVLPELDTLIVTMDSMSKSFAHIPMLAHTHGQPASPTKLGKEINVFVARLKKLRLQIKNYVY
jgi:adenylosuccinate lyase